VKFDKTAGIKAAMLLIGLLVSARIYKALNPDMRSVGYYALGS
jgi:hypothetical protein